MGKTWGGGSSSKLPKEAVERAAEMERRTRPEPAQRSDTSASMAETSGERQRRYTPREDRWRVRTGTPPQK
jgi:hypothetical protein